MMSVEACVEGLKRELKKTGSIILKSPCGGERVIINITATDIIYRHGASGTKSRYSISLLIQTYQDLYGKKVDRKALETYNPIYSSTGTPCNVMMFILLMQYWFQIPIMGAGVKGGACWIFLVHDNWRPALLRIFMKNIMIRSGNKYLSVTNPDDVLRAVTLAYQSMQPRTFRKNQKSVAAMNGGLKGKLLKEIAKELVAYFKAPPKNKSDFDDWHKALSGKIIALLKKLLSVSGYKISGATYGKAQKILNVAFKNLYLYDDAFIYEEYFEFCHFILDSGNLKWYNSVIKPSVATVWSRLDYKTYISIQKNVEAYLSKQYDYPHNPFKAEFYIWSDYQFN